MVIQRVAVVVNSQYFQDQKQVTLLLCDANDFVLL
jgi:hypothetical protein